MRMPRRTGVAAPLPRKVRVSFRYRPGPPWTRQSRLPADSTIGAGIRSVGLDPPAVSWASVRTSIVVPAGMSASSAMRCQTQAVTPLSNSHEDSVPCGTNAAAVSIRQSCACAAPGACTSASSVVPPCHSSRVIADCWPSTPTPTARQAPAPFGAKL